MRGFRYPCEGSETFARVARSIRRQLAAPDPPHLLTAFQQGVQRALRFHLAVFEHDDLVGAAQGGMAVRDHQAGRAGALEYPFPEGALGLYVEGAGVYLSNTSGIITGLEK